jgi:hypothetical protein
MRKRRCADPLCRRWFRPPRRASLFCSRACAQRHYSREYHRRVRGFGVRGPYRRARP